MKKDTKNNTSYKGWSEIFAADFKKKIQKPRLGIQGILVKKGVLMF